MMADGIIADHLRQLADELGLLTCGSIEGVNLRNRKTGRRFHRVTIKLEWDFRRGSWGYAYSRPALRSDLTSSKDPET